jgi:four helix bundle protein
MWSDGSYTLPMRDHKSLEAWKEANRVVNTVFDFCDAHWRPQARAAFDQLQRAALSVQLNLAEGYSLWSPARFKNHLQIAYGSAVETGELLELLASRGLLPSEPVEEALNACRRSQRLLLGLIKRYQTN